MKTLVLKTENLTKTFRDGTRAVDSVSLSVERGAVFGFLGPNGAGKSTTIRLILRLLEPDGGSVEICGIDVHKNRREALSRIGALVEGPAFYPYLTGRENLEAFAAYSGGVPSGRIDDLLETTGLADRRDDRVSTYSLGMKQRLGIAQALLASPELLILDEPTNGLDPYGVREIRTLLTALSREKGVTVFLSSHILGEVQQICDRVAIINRGRIAAEGEVSRLLGGNRRTYHIEGPDPDSFARFLVGYRGVELAERSPLKVRFDTLSPQRFLTDVVAAGFGITCYKPIESSLEELFFIVTGGDIGAVHKD
jgi:ABC-2 type transport system ATP-binding protein